MVVACGGVLHTARIVDTTDPRGVMVELECAHANRPTAHARSVRRPLPRRRRRRARRRRRDRRRGDRGRAHRRNGIGSVLFETLRAVALERTCSHIVISCDRICDVAKAFWLRRGFVGAAWLVLLSITDRKTSPDAPVFLLLIIFWSSRPEHNQKPPKDPANRHCALIPTRRKMAVSPSQRGGNAPPLARCRSHSGPHVITHTEWKVHCKLRRANEEPPPPGATWGWSQTTRTKAGRLQQPLTVSMMAIA